MLKLNLPSYEYKLRKESGKLFIYDELRKKYLVLTPEEWVRQHFLNFMISERSFPKSLIREEYLIRYNQLQKRADILAFNRDGQPLLMIECKASSEALDDKVFFQIITYNSRLGVPYLCVTNGISHLYGKIDQNTGNFSEMADIPMYDALND